MRKATRQLCALTVAALIAVAFCSTPVSARQEGSDYIYCRAEIVESTGFLAVELADSPGQTNTLWNMGTVPQGGVKDSWYDGGPGTFRLKNTGDTQAHIWITAEMPDGNDPIGEGFFMLPTNALPTGDRFALAFSTNVQDVAPSWNLLNRNYWPDQPPYDARPESTFRPFSKALAGEYVVFDLKFFAPQQLPSGPDRYSFRIGFYAVERRSAEDNDW